MTLEEKVRIDEALNQVNGDITQAAILMEMERKRLKDKIYNNADLRRKWTKHGRKEETPRTDPAIFRDVRQIPETTDIPIGCDQENQLALLAEVERENAALKKGLEEIGVTPDAMAEALVLQKFQRRFYSSSIELIGGGITKTFIEMRSMLKELTEEISAGVEDPEREKMLRDDRARIMELLGRTFDRAQKAALTQAIIRYKLNKKREVEKPKGFLSIDAKPGSQVNIGITRPEQGVVQEVVHEG